MGRLSDKSILITGGNSGIGLAAAQEFDREGARVAICGLNEGSLEAAKKTLGAGSLAVRADVSNLTDHGIFAGTNDLIEKRPLTLPSETVSAEVGSVRRVRVATLRRVLRELRRVTADVIPWGLRGHEDVHFNSDAWVAVNAAESHSMHFPFVYPTEGGATRLAEAEAVPRCRLIPGQVLFPADPRDRAGRDFRVCRT